MSVTAAIIASTLNAGTPLLLAGIGILIHEKSGVSPNLGIEGIMLMGAVCGFAATFATGSFRRSAFWPGLWPACSWRPVRILHVRALWCKSI